MRRWYSPDKGVSNIKIHILVAVGLAPLWAFTFVSASGVSTINTASDECVILLHGLGRTSWSMDKLSDFLAEKGYRCLNVNYPSTAKSIDEIARTDLFAAIDLAKQSGCNTIHFVTHSMGGIILRAFMQSHNLPEGVRVVMLSPPNQGSEVVDSLRDWFFFKWVTGPAGQQLGTDDESLPKQLKPISLQIGIIAGTRSLNPWFSNLLPGPDDGTVTVESTRLYEMVDFLEVKSGHTFIMRDPMVLEQVDYFLSHGKFDHANVLDHRKRTGNQ